MKENQASEPILDNVPPTPTNAEDIQSDETQRTPTESLTMPTADTTEHNNTAAVEEEASIDLLEEVPNSDEAIKEEEHEKGSAKEELIADAHNHLPTSDSPPKGIFSRLKQKKQQQAEQRMTEAERIRNRSGYTDDDLSLIFELGYEDELGRAIGFENMKILKQDHRQRFGQPGHKHYRTSFGYCGEETVNEETAPAILAKYAHDRKRLILRTGLTALATFIMLFLDFPVLLGVTEADVYESYPYLLPMLSIFLLLFTSALSIRQLNAGLRSFLKLIPTPYSIPATTVILVLAYDIATMLLRTSVLRVNTLMCLLLLLCALCDVLRIICEMRAFRVLSAPGDKTVLETVSPRKKKLRRGKQMIKVINDDIDETFYRIRRAEQTTGFFRRFNTQRSAHRPFQYMIGLIYAAAIVVAFLASLATSSLPSALSSFMTVIFIASPVTAIFCFFYPMYLANRILSASKCVLVGNEAVNEYAESKTIIFNDTDLYSSEKRTEISVNEGDDLNRDLRLSSILFSKIGGTLATVGKPLNPSQTPPTVSFVRIADNGVEAIVEGKYHMIAGSADFLKKSGIRVPKETTDRAVRRNDHTAVTYVAVDSVLKLTYEIEYTERISFISVMQDLSEIDTSVAIQSYDPNLNEAFIRVSRKDSKIPIRVIKPGRYETETTVKESDTGAVSAGEVSNILYPLQAAHAISRVKQLGYYLQAILSGTGILLTAVLSLFPSLPTISPLSIITYHAIFLVLSFIIAQLHINKYTLHIRRYF